ncbi:glycosyltransferase [Streptomyces caatingaensis]|uniref:Glycosyl transferase n=1 Tax=Streptomyces caatingaensis TaxID=1678637 RepID=A0A0K9XAZ3_9ACTN|nr:glycosyltransferase [Streptomyces caatingaensis]KNB50378.1 glycosyl transferase [Streptomyces caatingaensis]
MLVNVVTAVHAPHAAFLPAAWESLRRQSHRDWVWLVQIDGPQDAVLRALAECGAARDGRVDVAANGTGEGPAVTRNVALGRAEAELVQNADADDELEPDALALLAGALAAHPRAGFAVGHARDLLPGGALRPHQLPISDGTLPRGVLLDAWSTVGEGGYRLPVHPAGAMWRRELLLALGGWSALHGMEDTGLLMAASAVAEGVLVDAPTLRYRKHTGQLSARRDDFVGGGPQIEMVRRRAAVLRALPGWCAPDAVARPAC